MLSNKAKWGVFTLMWAFIILSPLIHAQEKASSTKRTYGQINFVELSKQIAALQQQYHYNPAELNSAEFKQIQNKVLKLAEQSNDLETFISEFNHLWQSGPFSHVRLAPAQTDAKSLAAYLDKMNVGKDAVQLSWPQADTARMAINTMMGVDTIENIHQAFLEINQHKPAKLIVDLRNNHGGAFAVKPLVEHLTEKKLDVGVFVSQLWFTKHSQPPQKQQIAQVASWNGWSIQRFWQDVQASPFTRVQMQPTAPHYSGKVYLLTSKQTASAAEMAADALSQLENVTIVGETTAGEMLSQTIFDLPHQLHLFIPVADYYSAVNGRIEGKGVKPDVQMKANQALQHALNNS
ncbi:S41 family peptidase [Catenovulum sp. SX2]|uniref:S41 family peptidase n=1 Tax=Catenovulum sp. SX2 TaxID=3398614 RepID=UPI003F8358AF